MANVYSNPTPQDKKAESIGPKDETVAFLLSYSKALSVINHKKWKFEALLN